CRARIPPGWARRRGRSARPRSSAWRGRPPPPPWRAPDRSSCAARSRGPSSELLQDADVVLEELAQVRDAVLEHRDPLDAHPERESLNLLRVVAALPHEAEDVRVHHPRTEDLDPADPLAERVPRAVGELSAAATAEAGDVDLDARLGEGEEAGPEARLALRSEDRAGELVQRALQVGKRDVRTHGEPLDLMEDRAVGRVERVGAVAAPRHHDEDRRRL